VCQTRIENIVRTYAAGHKYEGGTFIERRYNSYRLKLGRREPEQQDELRLNSNCETCKRIVKTVDKN